MFNVAQVVLRVIKGCLSDKEYVFDSRATCIIGRSKNCHIKIPNNKEFKDISRYHCLLEIKPPEIWIKDSGSLHGTFVNNECIGQRKKNQGTSEELPVKLSEYRLKNGDLIRLGNLVFQVNIKQFIPVASTFKIEEDLRKMPLPIEVNLDQNLGDLNNYIKIQKIGEGGCGEVYLARQKNTSELVAIKTMFPQVAMKPYMKEMFLREARNTKTLSHRNLVEFKDYGWSSDKFYFVMEYCDRGSVRDLIKVRKGKLIIEEATELVLQVLDALDYAHNKKKLVHRDIKPSNIFLKVEKGKLIAKLGDYGLAKSFELAGLSGQTLTGTKMGTPNFMPRQQVLDFKYAKPEVDVWAVAASLYYMLTLEYPRDLSTSFEQPILAVLETEPIPIRERDADIPYNLASLIDSALEDDCELHFKNALAFKNALLSVI